MDPSTDPTTTPQPRQGPRPLPPHLLTAINSWSSSRGALPMLRNDSISWKPEVAGRAAKLQRSLPPESASGTDPFAAAVEAEITARLAAFSAGINAYRHHPYRRRLPDPPALWESGATRLLDYGPANGHPVLFVPSLINRAYILDLSERRSLMRWMAAETGLRPLLVDWRRGEAHFMANLVDGDTCSNNGGWQWAAGTGTDAQQFIRIFNPTTQGKRFDPDGVYVRRWVPELADLPNNRIHEPWRLSEEDQEALGVVIGEDYPAPIVDHSEARQRAMDWWSQAT